jgi:hypothetical protein
MAVESSLMVNHLSQTFEPPVDQGPHRARTASEGDRDLRVGQVGVVPEHEGRSLPVRQRGQGGTQDAGVVRPPLLGGTVDDVDTASTPGVGGR